MKKIFTLLMGLVVVLSMSAAPRKSRVLNTTQRTHAQTEHVRRTAAKAPAALTDVSIAVTGNDLIVTYDENFWLMLAFAGQGIVDIYGGLNGPYSIEGYMYTDKENPDEWYGSYDAEDLEIYVYDNNNPDDEGTELTNIMSFVYSKTAQGDKLSAVGESEDGSVYEIELTLYATADKTETVNLQNAELTNYTIEEGIAYLWAAPADSAYAIALTVYADELPGSYDRNDLDRYYSYIRIGKNTYYDIAAIEFKIDANADGSYTYSGWMLVTNNTKYEFTIVAVEETTGIEGVQSTEHRTQKVLRNGMLFIEKNGKIFNAQGAEVR